MPDTFTCFVRGIPAPQGSKFAPKAGVVVDVNPTKLKDWRAAINFVLQDKWTGSSWEGPVVVDLAFTLPRPPSVSVKRRPQPVVKPDLDKLVRSVLDALTGICIKDDAQVVEIVASKGYDDEGDGCGLGIILARAR